MSISILRLPLASSVRLLQLDRHSLPLASARLLRLPPSTLRLFSTSPQDYASKLSTAEKKPEKAINQVVVSGDEIIQVSPCMEVFDIRVQRFDGKRNSRIYGTVGDTARKSFFYNRPIDNPESVHLGLHPLLLTGPEHPFTPHDPSEIDIDIKDADTDTEIIRASLSWNVKDCESSIQEEEEEEKDDGAGLGKGYNRFIREEFLGTYGSAMISYAVFDQAVSATVEIVLLNGAADVYGVVAASNTFLSQGHSVLFHREEKQNVSVGPGELVPLSRSVVALPVDSDLDVRVELWSCDGEMASETATFEHGKGTRSSKMISGQIEVRVTWTTC